MTIERLHSEDGYPVDSSKPLLGQIKRILISNQTKIEALPEGDYNLTPKWWTKHLMNHELTVLENGNGIYRMIPRNNRVGTADLDKQGLNKFEAGGKTIQLPQDDEVAVVGGPLKDGKTLGAYEIMFYIPGPSPKKKPNQA